MESQYYSALSAAINQVERNFPESEGSPDLQGFNLAVLPPWPDYTESEVLQVEITSAAVCCISYGRVLLTHMVNEGDRWDLPAGGKATSDLSPLGIAAREFLEETGLQLDTTIVEPFSYAYRRKLGRRVTGGIQYLSFQGVPIPKDAVLDSLGRVYFAPFAGALTSEVDRLVLEPIELFMSDKSILNSPNMWAYQGIYGALRRRFERIR